jgi:hypothetical protein
MPLPATNIRNNIATWSLADSVLPAVVNVMLDTLAPESFDPTFQGQWHQTTYFDTPGQLLRMARKPKKNYATLRLRSYAPSSAVGGLYPNCVFAFSIKTEDQKERIDIAPAVAESFLSGAPIEMDLLAQILPPDLYAKVLGLIDDQPLYPVVTVFCTGYATEDDNLRFTLDTCTTTNTGKKLPFNVLEFKAIQGTPAPPASLPIARMNPLKLSKFLWSTDWR